MLSQRKEENKKNQKDQEILDNKNHTMLFFFSSSSSMYERLEKSYIPTCQMSKIAANILHTNLKIIPRSLNDKHLMS